jgi:hypothetical protein
MIALRTIKWAGNIQSEGGGGEYLGKSTQRKNNIKMDCQEGNVVGGIGLV